MERIPILRMGRLLLVTIQVDMHDRLAMTLQDDLDDASAMSRRLKPGLVGKFEFGAGFRGRHCGRTGRMF